MGNYSITIEDKWVRIQVKPGVVITIDLILTLLNELYAMKAYQSEKEAGLWDFRGCTSDLTYQKMIEVKRYIDKYYNSSWSHNLTAFVVDKELLFGLARMYEMMAEDIPTTIRIFKDMDEAQDWLDTEISR